MAPLRRLALAAALLAAAVGAGCLAPDAARGCPDAGEIVIEVTTSRYAFQPGTQEPIEVPCGATVVLRVTSADVNHGLSIVELNVNEVVPAGETIEIRFRADRPGSFTIYCTVFCGSGHPQHKGTLHVA